MTPLCLEARPSLLFRRNRPPLTLVIPGSPTLPPPPRTSPVLEAAALPEEPRQEGPLLPGYFGPPPAYEDVIQPGYEGPPPQYFELQLQQGQPTRSCCSKLIQGCNHYWKRGRMRNLILFLIFVIVFLCLKLWGFKF